MPGVSGMEVLAAVREAAVKHRVPVVIMTSSKNAADVARSYALGANAYLPKPNDAASFAALIDAAVRFWTEINSLPWTPEDPSPYST
jgi:DNA-binding NarL/FixJ family response regulator